MSKQSMEFTHREVVVTYDDSRDWFMCHLFRRGAESPAKAKARIDEILDKEKLVPEEKFKRFAAWKNDRWGDSGSYVKVTVTSYVEGDEAWVSYGNGKSREKVNRAHLYPVNEHNDRLIALLLANAEAQKKLGDEARKIAVNLKNIAPES